MKEVKTHICPICVKTYHDYPAMSRKDNRTEICPECGIREALDDASVTPWTKGEIPVGMIKEQYRP